MIGPDHTVENLLQMIRDRSALLRHFGDSAAVNHDAPPDARAFSGLADAAGEIEDWAHSILNALDTDALGAQIGPKRRRDR